MDTFSALGLWAGSFFCVFIGVVISAYFFKRREMMKQLEAEQHTAELKKWVEEQTLDLKHANRKLKKALDQRESSEDALRRSEVANQALLRALPDRIFRIDRNGCFLDFRMNMAYQPASALEDIGARTLDEMKCKAFVDLMKTHMVLALDTGEMQSFEFEEGDGTDIHFQEVRVVQEGDAAVVAIVRDVSTRKNMEKHIIQLERQKALGQLSHGISHNFNNILTGILGPAQLIQKKSENEGIAQAVDMIIYSAKRASEWVQRLSKAVQPFSSYLQMKIPSKRAGLIWWNFGSTLLLVAW
jgi:PAS domain-containing protein